MTSAALPAERLQDEELLVIRESARLMGKSLEPGLVIREMLHLVSEFLRLNRGRVVLRQPGSHDFAIRYAYGLTAEEIGRGVYQAGDGVTGCVLQSGETAIVQDIDDDPHYLARAVERDRLPNETVSFIALPLRSEGEVLGLLARGLANKQIAVALHISEHTVKFHVSSIYTKLGVANRTEAVRKGIQRGLILL